MKLHPTYTVDLGILGEVDVDVWFTVSEYRPARLYLANGDPGYPEEGGEVDLERVNCKAYPMLNQVLYGYLADDQDFSEWAYDQMQDDDEPYYERDAA